MITDKNLRVSTAQAVTASAVSTDTIDLLTARDMGEGEALYVHFSVDAAATSAGATTVDFQVIGSAAAALTSPVILGASGPIAKADLIIGKKIAVRINPQIGSLAYRYLGANYVVAVANLSAGAFTADVVMDIGDGLKYYASGFSVT